MQRLWLFLLGLVVGVTLCLICLAGFCYPTYGHATTSRTEDVVHAGCSESEKYSEDLIYAKCNGEHIGYFLLGFKYTPTSGESRKIEAIAPVIVNGNTVGYFLVLEPKKK